MTFEEQAVELLKLEAQAKKIGMPGEAFERVALRVMQEAHRSSVERAPEQTLAEIRRRIEPPGTKNPLRPEPGG